jgi:hypothetical protein
MTKYRGRAKFNLGYYCVFPCLPRPTELLFLNSSSTARPPRSTRLALDKMGCARQRNGLTAISLQFSRARDNCHEFDGSQSCFALRDGMSKKFTVANFAASSAFGTSSSFSSSSSTRSSSPEGNPLLLVPPPITSSRHRDAQGLDPVSPEMTRIECGRTAEVFSPFASILVPSL